MALGCRRRCSGSCVCYGAGFEKESGCSSQTPVNALFSGMSSFVDVKSVAPDVAKEVQIVRAGRAGRDEVTFQGRSDSRELRVVTCDWQKERGQKEAGDRCAAVAAEQPKRRCITSDKDGSKKRVPVIAPCAPRLDGFVFVLWESKVTDWVGFGRMD